MCWLATVKEDDACVSCCGEAISWTDSSIISIGTCSTGNSSILHAALKHSESCSFAAIIDVELDAVLLKPRAGTSSSSCYSASSSLRMARVVRVILIVMTVMHKPTMMFMMVVIMTKMMMLLQVLVVLVVLMQTVMVKMKFM